MRHLVILGAGFAGLSAIHTLEQATLARRKIKLTLVSNSTHFLFTPLLPNVANGELSLKSITFPLKTYLDDSTNLIVEEIAHLEPDHARLITSSGESIAYDYLLLAPGTQIDWRGKESWQPHCLTCKSAEDAVLIRERVEQAFARAAHLPTSERESLLTFAFAGAGPTGVELLAELHASLKKDVFPRASPDLVSQVRLLLIEPGETILSHLPEELRQLATTHLARQPQITIHTKTSLTERTAHTITLSTGETIPCDHLFWCAGVRPHALIADHPDFEHDEQGRILTDSTLQALGHENIFVAGDCASPPDAPGQNAQAAKQQGPIAAQNILAALSGRAPKLFTFQHLGDMLTLGRGHAAIKVMGVPFSGKVAYAMYRAAYASLMPGALNKVQILAEWFEHDIATAKLLSLPNLTSDSLPPEPTSSLEPDEDGAGQRDA